MLVGAPLMVLKRTVVMRIILSLTLLPLAILFGFGLAAALTDKEPDTIGAAVMGLLGGGVLVLFLWLFRRESGRELRLHTDGLVQVVGGNKRELRWDDVTEIWFRAIRIQAGGLLGAAIGAAVDAARQAPPARLSEFSDNISVRVVGKGQTLKLSSNDRGVVAAFEEVLRRVNPRLVADCQRRLTDGQTVSFGKVSLSPAGIHFGRKAAIPYGEVEKLALSGGRLTVKKRGAWLSKGGIAIHTIPNVMVLAETFAHMTGGSATTEAAVGRNLASRQSL